jgi:uncharacterized membrane protein YccC
VVDGLRKNPVRTAWKWLRVHARERVAQLRLGLRVTVAAAAAFILAQVFTAPLAGLWAVLTAILVTQMSLGASLTATIEYFVGTLGGAIYAVTIAVLVPHHGEISLVVVLSLAIAPLAFLGAVNSHFRVGPFTAVIVILGATATHLAPLDSALYRVMEVALGGIIGVLVSILVLPARAQGLTIDAAADMLDLLSRALPELAGRFSGASDAIAVRMLQDSIGTAFARVETGAAEGSSERYLATGLDPSLLVRTLLRLRHDLVMLGRAVAPLPEALQAGLELPLAQVVDTGARYLGACSAALGARRNAPSLEEVRAALKVYTAAIAAARRGRLTRDLPADDVERLFAVRFAFEQLHADFSDLARCVDGFAQSSIARL